MVTQLLESDVSRSNSRSRKTSRKATMVMRLLSLFLLGLSM